MKISLGIIIININPDHWIITKNADLL